MLGVLLPKLNIWMTRRGKYKEGNKQDETALQKYTSNVNFKSSFVSMEEFANRLK